MLRKYKFGFDIWGGHILNCDDSNFYLVGSTCSK